MDIADDGSIRDLDGPKCRSCGDQLSPIMQDQKSRWCHTCHKKRTVDGETTTGKNRRTPREIRDKA